MREAIGCCGAASSSEILEPLFFGPSHHQLYGVYHPAARSRAVSAGVVLCYPAGQEYIRIHRAFRWLADQLAAIGFHVLRFDYTGQGDSAGEFADASLEQWIADGQLAIEELRSITGVRQVDLVGLRVGTLVAAALADQAAVRRLVLWEARAEPGAYHAEMLAQIAKSDQPLNDFIDDHGVVHLNGFAFSPGLLAAIDAFDVRNAPCRKVASVLFIGADEQHGPSGLAEQLQAQGARVDTSVIASPTDWNSIDDMGGLFLPLGTLRRIVEWLDVAD